MSLLPSANPNPAEAPPLSFTLIRGAGVSVIVREGRNRQGGLFTDLSSAIRFVKAQCRAAGCPVEMRFDISLALIRAAAG